MGRKMEFLERLFGTNEGQLCVVTINAGEREAHFFSYPDDLPLVSRKVAEWSNVAGTARGTNVYFYPVLLDADSLDAEIVYKPVIAADLDMVDPVLTSPRPNLIVESSGGRFQAYWWQKDYPDGAVPMSVNGPIADDVNLKRLPGARNWKYKGDTWTVREIDPSALDTYEIVETRRKLTGTSYKYLFDTNDRWALARLCARLGCSQSETYLVLEAAQSHAGVTVGSAGYVSTDKLYRDAVEAVKVASIPSLLTDDELRAESERTNGNGNGNGQHNEDSFIDLYLEWASRCTDAPKQYHIAGALTVLSALLSPLVNFPTSHGVYRPNLWFMILGATTLTRKTTSMEMAIRTAKCAIPDVVMSTNGSPEGVLTALSDRDGQGSIFFRDEVTGLFKNTRDKTYMADFLEMLTKLYDGGSERRTLRRQTIEVNDPYLVILCGGIKDATIELLNMDHVSSGFLLRFLIVTGSTRREDMKPIGPPEERTGEKLDVLNEYLTGLVSRYAPKKKNPLGVNTTTPKPGEDALSFGATEEAWRRLEKLEDDANTMGHNEANANVFGPLMERCKNSIIKVAVLLAADRVYRTGAEPLITLQDIVTAISYSNVWIESMYEVAMGIDDKPSKDELRNIRIEVAIRAAEEGVRRSAVMTRFRLTKKEMDAIEATLVDRGQIIISTVNRAKVYRSTAKEG